MTISETGKPHRENRLIQLIKTFSKEEMKGLEKFACSPFHNNRSDVAEFCTELKKFHPKFSQSNFSMENVFQALYPGKKYRNDVIRRLSSNLFKLAEEYGTYTFFRKKKLEYDKTLVEFYLARPAVDFAGKQIKKTEDLLEVQSFRDAGYFLNVNFLEESKRIYQVRGDSSATKIDLQKQIDSVWKFALITLFRLYKIGMEHTKQFDKTINVLHIEALIKFVEANGFMDSKALEIWYLLIQFHKGNKNDETFFRLKEMTEKNSKVFEPVERFIIYVSLLSYCFEMGITPSKNFRKEEFELLAEMLKDGLLLQDNVFHPEWFMYACIAALRAGEIAYAETFIENYKDSLPPEIRNNILNHAYAELEIERKNFERALELLVLTKYTNVAEKLRANHMYIKIYYELGMSEQFFYNIDSFRRLIKNEPSINRETKQIRENFIKFAVILFKVKLKETATLPDEIKNEIMSSKIMGHKWLIEKISEFES